MNYIKINNQKIPLTDEQVEQLRKTFVPNTTFPLVRVGQSGPFNYITQKG